MQRAPDSARAEQGEFGEVGGTLGRIVSGKVTFDGAGRIVAQGQPAFRAGNNIQIVDLTGDAATAFDSCLQKSIALFPIGTALMPNGQVLCREQHKRGGGCSAAH